LAVSVFLLDSFLFSSSFEYRREASRHFRNKKREYLKDKCNEIELNSQNKNIRDLYRGITEFKKGYQPKTNLVKD
jgi:hypothetical protein